MRGDDVYWRNENTKTHWRMAIRRFYCASGWVHLVKFVATRRKEKEQI